MRGTRRYLARQDEPAVLEQIAERLLVQEWRFVPDGLRQQIRDEVSTRPAVHAGQVHLASLPYTIYNSAYRWYGADMSRRLDRGRSA